MAVGTGALALAGATALGVLISVMARTVVTPPRQNSDDVRVIAADLQAGTLTLQATPDSMVPGHYGFWFSGDAGHARLGEILASDPHSVTRRVERVDFGNLGTARMGRWSGWVYLGPWSLPVPFTNVLIRTEGGQAPAWQIPPAREADAESGDWAIHVHGRAVRRQEALRAVSVFRDAGYTSLLVSYRNDGDAPFSTDRRYGLGDTEWQDIDAALDFALAHGAKRVVLMGWSMGGAIVLQTALRARHRSHVVGIVLDSPVINWAEVVAFQGTLLRLPASVARGAIQVMGHRWGRALTGQSAPIDFHRLDLVARAADLRVPVLLLHSDDDGYVPSTASRALAARRPDLITFVPFATARHTKLWNHDSEKWTGAIRSWLDDLTAR
ncbi:alpha/beta fold hydrolase [Glaciibacter psychrotolerans]|uniref:Pimeloyl-ACP methyl ester carboxylesterase n=1 Tax=Glaciibacter psychrotolerans TaxID=670054 RepID=A0A7Z0J5M1_9MICO|nr:pimeloyl-ACP methyl ester carboxylesterase [Leifsonia psychrotolerans]